VSEYPSLWYCPKLLVGIPMPEDYLSVQVHPKAGKEVLVRLAPGRYEAWVKARPFEGRANEAVAHLLARGLQISHERLRLIKGRAGRRKVFRVLSQT